MPAKIRIELDHDGIRELLHDSGIVAEMQSVGEQIASYAGPDWEVSEPIDMPSRTILRVQATTLDALIDQAENDVLQTAVR